MMKNKALEKKTGHRIGEGEVIYAAFSTIFKICLVIFDILMQRVKITYLSPAVSAPFSNSVLGKHAGYQNSRKIDPVQYL